MARRTRSKSPGPRRSSPTKKEPEAEEEAAESSPTDFLLEPKVQLGIGIAFLLALSIHQHGQPKSAEGLVHNFFGTLAEDVSLCSCWPFGIILTGHVLNACQNAGSGFWVGSLVNAAIAAFGSVLLVDFINGNRSSILGDESSMTLVAFAWYFCNHDVPLAAFNVWTIVHAKAGPWFQKFLDLCTTLFITNQILAAAATSSTAGPLGFSIFTPLAMALFAGAAGNFFPLNKGIDISECTPEMFRALTIAGYVVLLPFLMGNSIVGEPITAAHGLVSGFFGGHEVIAAVVIDHYFGHLVPFNPVAFVCDKLQKATGV